MTKKTLVNLISKQTIPNYLFIKEFYAPGDQLMFITSKSMKEKMNHILDTLGETYSKQVIEIDEENWSSMTEKIEAKLLKNSKYLINTTCGTKFMSLAVQSVFQKYDSSFFYIPNPENKLLAPFADKILPIKYRVGIPEYFRLHNIPYREKKIIKDKEYTFSFFNYFTKPILTNRNFEIIELLRENYRDKKSISIKEVEQYNLDPRYPKRVGIPDLSDFLTFIEFPLDNQGKLNKKELEYLTGGWFEEYIYHLIKKHIQVQDIAIGVEILKADTTNQNDLDVVFTFGNKLFVIECKTGINKQSIFNQTVYKASSLKETMFGLPGNTFIFSLSKENEEFIRMAKNMNVDYYGYEYFLEEDKLKELMAKIINIAKNQ
jgi:hypothetical protein